MDIRTLILNYSFDEWYEAYNRTIDLGETVGFDSDNARDEIMDDEEWIDFIKEEYKAKNKEENISWEKYLESQIQIRLDEEEMELIESFFDNYKSDVAEDFDYYAEDTGDGYIAYRSVDIKEDLGSLVEKFKNGRYPEGYDGIGVYFSWTESKAESHWAVEGSGETFLLKVEIPYICIDEDGILANLDPSIGLDEAEIRVKKEHQVKLISVNGIEINKIVYV